MTVRELVPGWVEWLGPVLFLTAMVVVIGLVPVAAVRITLRRLRAADHWTVRARDVYAARMAVVWGLLIVPAASLLLSTQAVGPLAPASPWLFGTAGALAAIAVASTTSWRLEGSVLGQPVGELRRYLTVVAVRWLPLVAIIALGISAPSRLASPWMTAWIVTALLLGLGLRLQPTWLAKTRLARPAGRTLDTMVREAGDRLGVEVRSVLVIDHHLPNAFAFPWLRTVAFTKGAVATLGHDELEAVTLHELGHLNEPGAMVFLRQAVHFVWIPVAALRPIHGSFGVVGVIAVLAALVALLVVVRRLATRMEARSDAQVLEHVHESTVYARALEKLYRIGNIPAVLKRAPHGQLHQRLETAGVAPDFTPPAPPSIRVLLACAVTAGILALALVALPSILSTRSSVDSPTPALVALSLGGYGSWPYERLGQLAEAEGDLDRALVWYEAAAEITTDPYRLAHVGYLQAATGRCNDARDTMQRLEHSGPTAGDFSYASEWLEWCRLGAEAARLP